MSVVVGVGSLHIDWAERSLGRGGGRAPWHDVGRGSRTEASGHAD